MTSDPKYAKLIAEMAEFQRLQMKSIANATFGGWTHEEVAAHDKRANRIAALRRQLDALG
jgi:hypothetical protein